MGFLSPKKTPTPPIPAATPVPTVDSTEVQSAADNERRRRVAMGGRASTILNDGSTAKTASSMLLGQ